MKKVLLIYITLLLALPAARSQDFKIHIGVGTDLDMGVRIDDNLAPNHKLIYQNSALMSADIFTKFSYAGFNITPDFKISWATFGKGKRTAVNEAGSSKPEGDYITIDHTGEFFETIDRDPYLLDKSNVTVDLMSAGIFLTHDVFPSDLGELEAGLGFFYAKKQVNFKEYMSHDVYDYYGSSGSHTSQYQTDEYLYKESIKDKKPRETRRMKSYMLSVPVIVQYNFNVGDYVTLSPAFVAYISKDSYYEIKFSVGVGNSW